MTATAQHILWKRTAIAAAAVAWIAIVINARTWADDEDHPRPASNARSVLQERSAENLADQILQLREEVGESNFGSLEAFAPLPTGDEEGEPEAPHSPPASEIFRDQIRQLHDAARASRQDMPDASPLAARDTARRSAGRVEALREAARLVDQAAHELECVDDYQRSDQLRRSAEALRHEARHLRPDSP